MVDAEDVAGLETALNSRLSFGTAGLRGEMGTGTSRMNDLVVVQTTQGLASYIEATGGKEGGVCIGYDHRANKSRSLRSERFAKLAAAVLVHRGIPVKIYSHEVATPLVPYCVDQMGCSAGVMVTASHNPPADNGYKVYWSNGAQIISPHDKGIAEHIENQLEPWAEYDAESVLSHPLCEDVTETMIPAYFADMKAKLCNHINENGEKEPLNPNSSDQTNSSAVNPQIQLTPPTLLSHRNRKASKWFILPCMASVVTSHGRHFLLSVFLLTSRRRLSKSLTLTSRRLSSPTPKKARVHLHWQWR